MKVKKNIIMILLSLILCFITVIIVRFSFQETYDTQYAQGKKTNEGKLDQIIEILTDAGTIIDKKTITIPEEGDLYATISVDRVSFEKPVYYGDNDGILEIGIGHYMKSGLPGEGKPILLAGHNGTHFWKLQDMQKDDIVKIKTSWGEYTYKIYDIQIMNATDFDTSQLNDEEERLIMYSCYPFDVPSTPTRYFVYASKVSGPILRGSAK